MGIEIERKFLLTGSEWKEKVEKKSAAFICQGYLNTEPERTVRVRLKDDKGFLTIKGKTEGISRSEFEYPIPEEDAAGLLKLCTSRIEKRRYTVTVNGQTWEVDEFLGENEGLVLAEAELEREDQVLEVPSWIGREVTEDPRYYNSYLSTYPYKQWKF